MAVSTELGQRGQQWLEELLQRSGLHSTVKVEMDHPLLEGGCWLVIDDSDLTPEQINGLTGPGGSVLDSMQYLANTILNLGREADQQCSFTIELAGYRLRRLEQLKQLAQQAVEQVRQTGEECEIKALSSAERRQVHTLLEEYGDLETFSRGQEPDRRLVVRPVQPPDE
ncbi:MAG: protein jag [Leptolyngbyaceae cyanobacterium]